MKWQKKLNKTELEHLKFAVGDCVAPTLNNFRIARQKQVEQQKEWKADELCWDCHFIAVKLGIE